MKITELAQGEQFLNILEDLAEIDGTYDMDPKTKAFVKMGQKITASLSIGSGVEWPDDDQFNKAAKLGQQLSSIGSSFGARNAGEALKSAGVTPDEAKEIIAKVKDKKIDIAKTVKDPDHSGEEKLAKAIQGEARMADMADIADHWPKISKMKMDLVDKGMEPEEAHEKASEYYGFDPMAVYDYIEMERSGREDA